MSGDMFLLAIFSVYANDRGSELRFQLSFLTADLSWPGCLLFYLSGTVFPVSAWLPALTLDLSLFSFHQLECGLMLFYVFNMVFRTKLGHGHK